MYSNHLNIELRCTFSINQVTLGRKPTFDTVPDGDFGTMFSLLCEPCRRCQVNLIRELSKLVLYCPSEAPQETSVH